MSEKSQEGQEDENKDMPQFLVDAINQANFVLQDDELAEQDAIINPTQASYLRKLTKKPTARDSKAKSQLALMEEGKVGRRASDAASQCDDIHMPQPQPFVVKLIDARYMTQGNIGFPSRQSSPNKQSVLMKRVLQDGRVVSGLDNNDNQERDDLEMDEDVGTLASAGEPVQKDAMARESNIRNYPTNESNESRLRSTIYISGKSQKFAVAATGKDRGKGAQGRSSPTGRNNPITKTMIINLGDRTYAGKFPGNSQLGNEEITDMVVGVTDIVTGATMVNHSPSNRSNGGGRFSPRIRPKQTNRSSSVDSNRTGDYPVDPEMIKSQAESKFLETGAQVMAGDFATPSPGYYLSYEEKAKYDYGKHQNDPMMISQMKLSPEHMKRVSPSPGLENKNNISSAMLETIVMPQVLQTNLDNKGLSINIKHERRNIVAVQNVDARALIPSQPNLETNKSPNRQQDKHKRSTERLAGQTFRQRGGSQSKSPQRSPKRIVPNDIQLQQFHQAQAQQYKNFMNNSGNLSTDPSRFASQQTLFGQYLNDEERKMSDVELRPNQINQGSQGSETMLQILDEQFNQLKIATNESFFVPNPLKQRDMVGRGKTLLLTEPSKNLLDTPVRTSVKQIIPHTQVNSTANITRVEQFGLTDRSPVMNSRVVSTYRGNDNMKLKIIDQSVLKTYGSSQKSSARVQNTDQQVEKRNSQFILEDDTQDHLQQQMPVQGQQEVEKQLMQPLRKSVIYDMLKQQEEVPIIPIHQEKLSPYESSIMQKASPLSKIESFRALLRQESVQNELLILNNQENFKNLINPEITRKQEYTILGHSASNQAFYMGNVQNQQLLTKKGEEMLHTVTDEFLDDRYSQTREKNNPSGASSKKFAIDPQEFRAKLQKKIDELKKLEVSDSQIIREFEDSREDSFGSLPGSRSQDSQSIENSLFMTFLQHGKDAPFVSARNQANFSTEETTRKKAQLKKQLSKALEKNSSELPLLTPNMKQKQARFETNVMTPGSVQYSEKVKIQQHNNSTVPIKLEHDLTSFAESHRNITKNGPKISKATLVESGSNQTIAQLARRYQREQRIVVFEDGAHLSSNTPCFQIDLNQLLMKYFLQQNGVSEFTTHQEDVTAQLRMYERAIFEILDQCGSRLGQLEELTPEELTRLDGAAPKLFNQLYSVYGEEITSLIQIDEEVCILIAGNKEVFKGLKTTKLFATEETASDMMNRILDQSPIKFDKQSTFSEMPLNGTCSTRDTRFRPSPFKLQPVTESPGKTFDLTQMSSSVDDISPRKALKVGSRRYVSLNTSRDIIRASKKEMVEHLTSPRADGSKNQLHEQLSLRNRLSQQSSNSITMRQKRLASITLITKGIKKGRLPPIKTPKQLDVFVFGEQPTQQPTVGASLHRRHQRTMTVEDQYQQKVTVMQPTFTIPLEKLNNSVDFGQQFDKKRGTEFQLQVNGGQSLLNSIKLDGSITGSQAKQLNLIHHIPHSSMAVGVTNHGVTDFARKEALSVSLKKNLETVNSVQRIVDQSRSSAGQRKGTEDDSHAKDSISSKNINIAQVALKDKNPSYLNLKLVSRISLQENKIQEKVQYKLSKKQKNQMKADVNEHVLQNALKQREQWRAEHKLADKQLFKIFSEFSSMMQIDRARKNDEGPNSFVNKLERSTAAHTNQSETFLDKLFPIGNSVSSTKFNKMKKEDSHMNNKLKKSDLQDFKVPVQICVEFSEVLRPTKLRLRTTVMNALGIATDHSKAKITYDQFLKMNSFIRYNMGTVDEYFWFCVRLFDPHLGGFTDAAHCETIIDLLFDNQDEDGNTTKPPVVNLPQSKNSVVIVDNASFASDDSESPDDDGEDEEDGTIKTGVRDIENNPVVQATQTALNISPQATDSLSNLDINFLPGAMGQVNAKNATASKRAKKKLEKGEKKMKKAAAANAQQKDESVSSNIKKICYEKGIFKADGFLDPNKLFQAFKDGLMDVEDFKSALK